MTIVFVNDKGSELKKNETAAFKRRVNDAMENLTSWAEAYDSTLSISAEYIEITISGDNKIENVVSINDTADRILKAAGPYERNGLNDILKEKYDADEASVFLPQRRGQVRHIHISEYSVRVYGSKL